MRTLKHLFRQNAIAATLSGLMLSALLFTGCGGPDTCKCLEEADKENPNQVFMEECREAFSEMSMEAVEAAVKKCGR